MRLIEFILFGLFVLFCVIKLSEFQNKQLNAKQDYQTKFDCIERGKKPILNDEKWSCD